MGRSFGAIRCAGFDSGFYNEPMTVGNSNTPRPAFSQSGVDLTMLLWMASKTPEERLRILQGNVNAILRARNARNRD